MSAYLKKMTVITILLTLAFSAGLFGQKLKPVPKKTVLKSLNSAAKYAANTILDKDAKSRCDYNMVEGRWYDYEIPWHTGQIIYGLVEAYRITKNPEYLDRAKQAGDWWTTLEIKEPPALKGMVKSVHGDFVGDVIVFATTSDGTPGLFQLYKETGIKKYAQIPTQAGEWMLKHMYVPEKGVFYDNVDPKTGEVLKENSPFWPDKSHPTLYDVARPNNEGSLYKDMYEFTGNEKYKKVFIDLCESLVEKQGPEGLWMDFMPNHKAEGSFHPRFNLWYAESLLEGYDLTGDKRYLEAAKKTAQMFARVQHGDGTIYYENHLDGTANRNSVCGSAVAFAGMMWIRLVGYGVGDEFKNNIEMAAHWLVKNQFAADHPDPNLAGAYMNTRTRHKKGKVWLVNRDVGTSFGMRFMAAYYRYERY